MKKIIYVLLVAAFLMSCGGGQNKEADPSPGTPEYPNLDGKFLITSDLSFAPCVEAKQTGVDFSFRGTELLTGEFVENGDEFEIVFDDFIAEDNTTISGCVGTSSNWSKSFTVQDCKMGKIKLDSMLFEVINVSKCADVEFGPYTYSRKTMVGCIDDYIAAPITNFLKKSLRIEWILDGTNPVVATRDSTKDEWDAVFVDDEIAPNNVVITGYSTSPEVMVTSILYDEDEEGRLNGADNNDDNYVCDFVANDEEMTLECGGCTVTYEIE